jgi:hypothetical protein
MDANSARVACAAAAFSAVFTVVLGEVADVGAAATVVGVGVVVVGLAETTLVVFEVELLL